MARVAEFRAVAAEMRADLTSTSDEVIRALLREVGHEPGSLSAAALATRTRSALQVVDTLRAGRGAGPGPIDRLRSLGSDRFERSEGAERRAWTALSIFTGDFTLDQATQVLASCGDARGEDVVDDLVADLVLSTEPHDDSIRFRLPTVYAVPARAALHADSSLLSAARRGRRAWWMSRARAIDEGWFGSQQRALFAEVSAEVEGVIALIADASDEDAGEVAEIVALLEPFWSATARIEIAVDALARLLRSDTLTVEQRFQALWVLAWLMSSVDAVSAERLVTEAEDLVPLVRTSVPEAPARCARVAGMCALYRGDAGAAQALFQSALDDDGGASRESDVFMDLSLLASAASLAGDQTVAYDFCERAIAMCERRGETWLKNYTLWAFALTAWRDGASHRAYVLALDSIEAAIEIDDRYAGAIALEIAGWYHASDDAELAARLLGVADQLRRDIRIPTLFWGTKDPHDDAIRQAIAILGPQAFHAAFRGVEHDGMRTAFGWLQRRSAGTDPHGGSRIVENVLTPRQREIAGLIAEGKTNKEIARALLITARTVEAHIEHIFQKLGVTSRAQVAVWSATTPQR